MRRAVERLPDGAERWATFLTFDERMNARTHRAVAAYDPRR